MFELETILKGLPDDFDADLPLSVDSAREITDNFSALRTALRRIISLDEKNVHKYAQQIAAAALQKTST